ncbi:Alpha-aminoadipic semialdehyde dehydrogenase [Quaeritorhiza haematococci]|nr:Alpha-aminoadipic semialdehyde dehydrogenase [Quaeritorhiza haematococci]
MLRVFNSSILRQAAKPRIASLASRRVLTNYRTLATSAPTAEDESSQHVSLFKELGLESENLGVYNGKWGGKGPLTYSVNPATNKVIGAVKTGTVEELNNTLKEVQKAKEVWRAIPAPRRGEIVRQMREALASKSHALGRLVSLEMGKILPEGIGEVQEYIDICDYATGLSRMFSGKVIPSERG